MALSRDPDGSLRIHENPRVARAALGIAAIAIVYGVFADAGSADKPIRRFLAGLAGVAFLFAAARLEALTYRFDPRSRTLEWRRWYLLGGKGGTLPFDGIQAVDFRETLERDNPAVPKIAYQPVLRTTAGDLPLSLLTSHVREDFTPLVEAVRATLGSQLRASHPGPVPGGETS